MTVCRILDGRHGRPARLLQHQSRQPPGAGECGRAGRGHDAPAGRGPDPPARLPRLHRHGAGAGDRPGLAAHLPAQLPRPERHQGRPGLPLLPGDRRRGRLFGVITDPRKLGEADALAAQCRTRSNIWSTTPASSSRRRELAADGDRHRPEHRALPRFRARCPETLRPR